MKFSTDSDVQFPNSDTPGSRKCLLNSKVSSFQGKKICPLELTVVQSVVHGWTISNSCQAPPQAWFLALYYGLNVDAQTNQQTNKCKKCKATPGLARCMRSACLAGKMVQKLGLGYMFSLMLINAKFPCVICVGGRVHTISMKSAGCIQYQKQVDF